MKGNIMSTQLDRIEKKLDFVIAAGGGYRKPRTITDHYADGGTDSLRGGTVILSPRRSTASPIRRDVLRPQRQHLGLLGTGTAHHRPVRTGGHGMSLDLNAIRARADAAVQGPWYVDDKEQTVRAREYAGEIMFDRSTESRSEWAQGFKPSAEFIAHARTDVPALLDELDRAHAALARVKALAEKWRYKGEFGWGWTYDKPGTYELLQSMAEAHNAATHPKEDQ
jgi:hypothetical protein